LQVALVLKRPSNQIVSQTVWSFYGRVCVEIPQKQITPINPEKICANRRNPQSNW
jgi:hypothetical protein